MYDVIIIGAGTAGLSAAVYACRAGKKVLIFESNHYGGQIVNSLSVENYPGIISISGFDFANGLYNQAIGVGCEYKNEKVLQIVDKNTVQTDKDIYSTKTIIIATGLQKRMLGLYGEKDFIGKGVSYCAMCDGNFFKNKDVAVVGGGNTALEDALYLANIANRVYLIHRRDTFRGEEETFKCLQECDNVIVIPNAVVASLTGEEKVEGIKIQVDDEEREIPLSGLFIAIGGMPDNLKFSSIVQLDEEGYIVSSNCETNISNIFVAGDARTKMVRQLVTAAGDGAVAATKAVAYIQNH